MIYSLSNDTNLDQFRGLVFEWFGSTRRLFRMNLILSIPIGRSEWVECNFGREWRYGRKEFILVVWAQPWQRPKAKFVTQYRFGGS